MFVDMKEWWVDINTAGRLYDFGFADVRIGGKVMEPTGEVTEITEAERNKIADLADEYSASK